ncbi:MAG: TylF/MycF/NovP-related O-methyltransferase [Nanoarchaeota archaeon]
MKELLKKAFVRFRWSKPTYWLRNLILYSTAEEVLRRAMGFIALGKIEGDYAEFGVYEGHSFISAYKFAEQLEIKNMNFWAFDSFEGFPEIKGIDKEGIWKTGEYSYSLKNFMKTLRENRVDLNKVFTVKGFYSETLKKKYKMKKLAVAYIDCDLYESTKEVLGFIEPYLQEGTIIHFDDWNAFKGRPDKGEQKAFWDFVKRCKKFKFIEYYNSGYNKTFLTLKNN